MEKRVWARTSSLIGRMSLNRGSFIWLLKDTHFSIHNHLMCCKIFNPVPRWTPPSKQTSLDVSPAQHSLTLDQQGYWLDTGDIFGIRGSPVRQTSMVWANITTAKNLPGDQIPASPPSLRFKTKFARNYFQG